MPFRVVSGVGRGMDVLDGVVIVEGRDSFGAEFGASREGDALFPDYFCEDSLVCRTLQQRTPSD